MNRQFGVTPACGGSGVPVLPHLHRSVRPVIVTLLTDFGLSDHFVAAMKGVILSRDGSITIVDISHEVPSQQIVTGAFLLDAVYRDFPEGTVHTVVVDPGVGSERRALAASKKGQFFVGPENGVLDPILSSGDDPAQVHSIENPKLMTKEISRTFHGRDIFAPTAAALATGFLLSEVGPEVVDPVRPEKRRAGRQSDDRTTARVLHVDGFGNCITSFRAEDLGGGAERFTYRVGGREVSDVREYFAGAEEGVPFAFWGSSGYLELAVRNASAANLLEIGLGAEVTAVPR